MENSLELIHKKINNLHQELKGKGLIPAIEADLMKDYLRQAYEIYCNCQNVAVDIEPKKETVVEKKVEDPVEQVIPSEEKAIEKKEDVVAEKIVEETKISEEVKEDKSSGQVKNEEKKSINEIIAQSKKQSSIGERLQKKKIADLTKSIGINEKFAFTRELFKGDSGAYNKAIKRYNEQESLDEALNILNSDLEKFDWDAESEEFMMLVDFVERRYM